MTFRYVMTRCCMLALTTFLAAASTPVTADPADDLYSLYWQDRLHLDPQRAIQLGERSALDQFDRSLETAWQEAMVATLTRHKTSADAFIPSKLSDANRRSLAMLKAEIDADLRFYKSASFELSRLLPIDQFDGPHLAFAQDAAGSGAAPFKSVEDYDLALRRADAFATWSQHAIERLREGMSRDIVLPRLVVERVLPQLAVHLKPAVEDTEFWRPIRLMPQSFSQADRDRLSTAYRDKILNVIQPAYRRLHDFLKEDYLPHARTSVGLGGLPGGAELYEHRVRFHTTTDLSPREIHELGLKEVERISREIDRVRHLLGYRGSRQAFYQAVRTNPALHFESPEEVIPTYQAAAARIVPHLPALFATLPRAPYEIRPLPPDSSGAFQGNGDYAAPAADGSRPGILWMNIYSPGVRDRYNVMTISLHEGRPGHHFQASVALEKTDLPAFRRSGNYTAFIEGWGLYAESLGLEMHLFDDPWQYFGHLNYAILRANRLVIDTGLHAYGWTVEDGVRWMTEHSSMTPQQARDEVERYVAYPGQALAYKVGELKIRALRARAERALGSRFDVRRFHDRVLQGGPVPLTDLEDDIQRWIEDESRDTPLTVVH